VAAERAAADRAAELIRVAVVDDDDLVRSGLQAILGLEEDITVVGGGADGTDVPALVAATHPDVVLMDVRMPRIDGIAATERITRTGDGPAVVIITTFENDDAVHDALLAGARGFVLKRATPEQLLAPSPAASRWSSPRRFGGSLRPGGRRPGHRGRRG